MTTGALRQVVPASLEFYFEIVARGTRLRGGAAGAAAGGRAAALRGLRPGVGARRAGVPVPGLRERHRRVSRWQRAGGRVDRDRGGGSMHRTKVRVATDALDANDTIAAANRADFDRAGVKVVNLMSAPGAGKTTLLECALARRDRRRADRRARGRRAGQHGRRPAVGAPRAGHPAEHRQRLRRRVPPRRQHGALGAAGDRPRRDRHAADRERGQPRVPRRVPRGGGRAGDGGVGGRGRGQAAQVPAHVPHLRVRGREQDRPAARTWTSTWSTSSRTSTRSTPAWSTRS